jgi:hypothetical protein
MNDREDYADSCSYRFSDLNEYTGETGERETLHM